MTSDPLLAIGVGIDTARYGHHACFLRPDRQPAAPSLPFRESHDGYQALRERLDTLHRRHPEAHFHVHLDAAGQYAANLERFLRSLPLPMTLSIGSPQRNKDYRNVHSPKRTTDQTESLAMARFGVVERPSATPAVPEDVAALRELAGWLLAQTRQSTQAVNRLHNLMARVFPELAPCAPDFTAGWVLNLLDRYPTPEAIAQAGVAALEAIPFIPRDKPAQVYAAAGPSVGSLRGAVAESLVGHHVGQVRGSQAAEARLRKQLVAAYRALPPTGHRHLTTIPGIGAATAAVLVAHIGTIDRFATPEHLVNYFGVFPEAHTSGVDKDGRPRPAGAGHMSRKGNDHVRAYLWLAAQTAIRCNPAVRALYRRQRARGKRGDVALGHCMRKLLHLVFAVWKTDRPFDPEHFPWEATEAGPADERAVGHTPGQDPAEQVVTTAAANVAPAAPAVNRPAAPAAPASARPPARARGEIDFAALRRQVSLEQVLRHLGLWEGLTGHPPQMRGRCPFHAGDRRTRPFSVHLGKGVYRCFDASCQAHGNVLDFWASYQGLPLYEAAVHLAGTFGVPVPRNREEEPVGEPVRG